MHARAFLALVLASAGLTSAAGGCGPSDITAPDVQVQVTSPDAQTSNGLAHPERPFKAQLEGLVTFGPDPEGRCPTPSLGFITYTNGTGEGTHLGYFQHTASHCPAPAEGEPPPYLVIVGGEWTFVAANGDELYAQYEGEQLTPVFANPTLVAGEVIFTGGTGRFSGASGWAHFEGSLVVPEDPQAEPWYIEQTLEGRISY